jgi:hypothetical protein
VAYYDNPAGRLHELLRQFGEQNPDGSVLAGWAAVLDVDEEEAILHIGPVLDLVRQIDEAVERTGEETLRDPVARLRATWARPMLAPDQQYNGKLGQVRLGKEPLQTLGLVSGQLHLLASEGEVPDSDRLNELKQQVRELVAAVRGSDDLPGEVKQAIAGRLIDVEKAIEHIHIRGPDGARIAMEAVMGAVVHSATTDPSTVRNPAMHKVMATIAAMCVVFTAGDPIQKNIEAWPKIVHEITTGEVVNADPNKNDAASDDKGKPSRTAEKSKTSH